MDRVVSGASVAAVVGASVAGSVGANVAGTGGSVTGIWVGSSSSAVGAAVSSGRVSARTGVTSWLTSTRASSRASSFFIGSPFLPQVGCFRMSCFWLAYQLHILYQ